MNDKIQPKINIECNIFEDILRHFVREWLPDNDRDRYEMCMQLALLMRDAMQLQARLMSDDIDNYMSTKLRECSLSSLNVIFYKDK